MKKKNEKFTFGDLIVLGIIGIIVYFLFFNNEETEKTKKTKNKEEHTRTIMLYMSPADLESNNGHATKDLNAIDKDKFDFDHYKLIVMAGGTNNWYNDFSRDTMIYEYTKDGYKKIDNYNSNYQNMGDQNTFTYFLDYVYDNYKSDYYDLMFYGHGSGVSGVLPDEIHNDNLSLQDIGFGIMNSKMYDNYKTMNDKAFEMVIFNSCLIGTSETYENLSLYTKYVIASEEVTWLTKDPVLNVFNDFKSTDDPIDIGKKYINNYKNTVSSISNQSHNLAMVDITNYWLLTNDLNDLFEKIDANKNYDDIVSIRSKMHQFGYEDTAFDEVDLYDLFEKFQKYNVDVFTSFKEHYKDTVVYNWSNTSYMKGISIYFPYYDGTDSDNLIIENTSIFKDTTNKYNVFIKSFIEKQKELAS